MKSLGWIFICLTLAATWCKAELPLEKLTLPAGFKISIWAKVPQARSLAIAPDGRVFVGNRDGSSVYVIQDGQTKVLAEGLNAPNGVAYRKGKLYVAELNRILEFNVASTLSLPLKASRILSQSFPSDFHHGWKFIRFGPDGKLYVPVGSNCNVCNPQKQYGRIFRVDVDGTSVEEVAKGVRNTVGFDFHPVTHELWFTENGRDLLGEDLPPDEINHVTTLGQHFGFPFCHGKNNVDPEYGGLGQCKDSTPPAFELRAHVAALGMRFYTGTMFPAVYRDGFFFAEHGSWNRTIPQGYRLAFAHLKGSQVVKVESIIEGFLEGATAWGGPVDMEIMKDGSLLISDDRAGVIYRLTYQP